MEQRIEQQLDWSDYVGFWSRVLVTFIDFVILALPTFVLDRMSISVAVSAGSVFPLFIQFALLMGFNVFMVVKYGGTPGKLILGMRIVDGDGRYPGLKQALIRDCLFIINGFLAVIVSLNSEELSAVSSSLANWSPLATDLNVILGWVVVADCLIVAFTQRNRALHDMVAGTYVVKKTSLDHLV
ncbi:RDD family protein [Paenibacillus tritici]|uniref:RDD family protein n=1 Tax=Paenibacillus tritici TaxID=1873425 RepID=UPI001BA89C0B|nr:RDD family protein [Paenibacillus tritici]QUL56011.1 RDD family protein [Paenibacillus tritici]